MQCAIVPLKPKELTPPTAATTRSRLSAPPCCVPSWQAQPCIADCTCGLTRRSWAFGARARLPAALASLSRPASPAAVSACPMFALMLPTGKAHTSASRRRSNVLTSDRTSMGSPSAVPVPCASSRPTWPALTAASSAARRSSSCCACPFGAVKLALRPSCRTQLPRTLHTGAAADISSATATQPSPRAKPSALRSKVWLRPAGDVMPAMANVRLLSGRSIRLTPAARCAAQASPCTARAAACMATREAEHAASME
mmetsp:Transcript_41797/g.137681  ORF Transcript_41797/g.137681 Transcript_41797/m.137681 type:complete len:256 (-) Transcript_41797:93-860(-)